MSNTIATLIDKTAETQHDVLDLIKKRWSPRSFSEKTVENDKLQRIFEAASWAASAFNEQPWRFIVGIKGDGENYEKVFSGFNEFNQTWLKTAPVVFFIVAKKTFSHDGSKNGWNEYDAGQAAASLTIQATAEGLYVHQMAGINRDKIIELFNIPDDYYPVTGFGLGYLGSPDALPDFLREREIEKRTRFPLSKIVFSDSWEQPSNIV